MKNGIYTISVVNLINILGIVNTAKPGPLGVKYMIGSEICARNKKSRVIKIFINILKKNMINV